jgi:hypothetical protein
MLELLHAAQAKVVQNGPHPQGYPEHGMDPSKHYYGPPPGAYYYPGYAGAPPPPLPEGAMAYYPPPPPHDQYGNLPPPDIARMIPCRFYPACRYGTSCLFAHPPGPYYGPPTGQYPVQYEPVSAPPFPQGYYPVSPPFQSPNGVPPHIDPSSPGNGQHPTPPPPHARSGSDAVSPIQTQFPPMGPPGPYSAVSPVAAPFTGPVPVPMTVPPLAPLQHPPAAPVGNSPYATTPPGPAPFPVQPAPLHAQDAPPEANVVNSPPPADAYGPPHPREFPSHNRRGSMRRPSFGRKPPCIFFPSGRCRNG